ncbi:MAG: aspartate/glutamate racemase family protein [Candidatus Korarchaeum sp.]|nr:aspartate/glutamate racemase family protein [Candidatus Korarchaeum sp.]MDW8036086.1 aspartate/glutamate racemase family protein [Candidatus Korarchaeum sp.]
MAGRRILFLNPIGTTVFDETMRNYLNEYKDTETDVDVISLPSGPHHLEYYSYDSIVSPVILKEVIKAERSGYDAFIIGCFYDPALIEAREVSKIVVTGPAESSFFIASLLGGKFSVVVGRRKWIPLMEENVVKYGLRDRLVSLEPIGLGVHDLHKDEDETKARTIQAAKKAIEKGAEVIVLGCTVFFGFYRELQSEIGVPVVDPVIASLKVAELKVDLKRKCGWSYSRVGLYEMPPRSEIDEWSLFR